VATETAAFVCPACGQPVKPGEDYVVAREHPGEPEVTIHLIGERSPERVQRRFHVGHFRGRIGDFFYELVRSPGVDSQK
jgi:hypothetical protein